VPLTADPGQDYGFAGSEEDGSASLKSADPAIIHRCRAKKKRNPLFYAGIKSEVFGY
jgi:hypothetical protein